MKTSDLGRLRFLSGHLRSGWFSELGGWSRPLCRDRTGLGSLGVAGPVADLRAVCVLAQLVPWLWLSLSPGSSTVTLES